MGTFLMVVLHIKYMIYCTVKELLTNDIFLNGVFESFLVMFHNEALNRSKH